MAKLSDDQINFLKRYGIKLEDTLDASGMARAKYTSVMKEKGLIVAFGTTPCRESKHTLRSSSGHCVQCNPLSLVYTKRHHKTQFIYVAESKLKKLIKVGVSIDVIQREKTLRSQSYGGAWDWRIRHKEVVKNSGVIECEVHKLLNAHHVTSTTYKDGTDQETYELFSCTTEEAIAAVQSVLRKL